MRITSAQLDAINNQSWRKSSGVIVVVPKKSKQYTVIPKPELSINEAKLMQQMMTEKVPLPEHNYRFHDSRKWQFDFAWPDLKLAIEAEGGTYSKGRHVRHQGYADDCEKYNAALDLGWRVYRYTCDQISAGMAIDKIKELVRI